MSKKRIGVTGGTGFIGRYLLRDYADQYDFVCATSQAAPRKPVPGVEYRQSDYSKESFCLIFQGCDAIAHLGGHVMKGLDKEIHVAPYVPNLTLAESVFHAARTLGIQNVVNASSVAVYKHLDDQPTKETDPCFPGSVYGIIKLAVEKLSDLFNKRYDLRIKSLRFGQGLGIPDNIDSGRFWSVVLKNCLDGKPVPIWEDVENNGRDLIYVKDMALAVVKALEHPELTGCFNIGTGRLTTNIEVAKAYCDVFHNQAGLKMVPYDKVIVDRAWMDCSKAKSELGFTPQYDLLSMVRDIRTELERKS